VRSKQPRLVRGISMSTLRERKFYIVKHGLDSFEALPNNVWRTGRGPEDIPSKFNSIKVGDRWVAFAYTTSDHRERSLSLVTGFFECIKERIYTDIPPKALPISCGETKAWIIEGKQYGQHIQWPVGVPPIDEMLGRKHFKSQAIVSITEPDFKSIYDYVINHEFNTEMIPLLARQPKNEQEVLAIVVAGREKLGIEEIVQIQSGFPDLLVKIKGHTEYVYLELEVYSRNFIQHGHVEQVRKRQFKGKPVAILCWVDNDLKVEKYVHRVFEVSTLIREQKAISW
jgi:hypothetical protein